MISENHHRKCSDKRTPLLAAVLVVCCLTGTALAQVTASITGTVRDSSGAVVPGAAVTTKNLESGLTRSSETNSNGSYSLPTLPVGEYEVDVEKAGFKHESRHGITLAVGQQAVVNLTLEIGSVQQEVMVTAEPPIVNTTLSSTSGLVGEKEVKDLPLNGRSFDQLLTLNTSTVNYSANASNGTKGNLFSVAGRRPEENRFLVNGVDYLGTDNTGSTITPQGASNQLLGVDAVREFNVVQHSYGAEYGKRAGGQVSIVTTSGTNQLHGDLFEYLRNSVLDSAKWEDNAFGGSKAPFKRNQFGGALGGPLKKDKLFLFGNYEGFRQRLGLSSVAFVPDAQARQGLLPIGPNNSEIQVPNLKSGMLPFFSFWPAPNGPSLGGGIALAVGNPLQKVREDFGLTRFDYNMSPNDSFSANYLIDDGENDLPLSDPVFIQVHPQRSQVLGLQETHVFSPTLLNVATLGFSRAKTTEGRVPFVPIPANLSFISGFTPGTITIGGGTSVQNAASITAAPGQNPTNNTRNHFTLADDLHWIKGTHSLSAGGWIQRIRANQFGVSTGSAGSISYPTLLAFLQDQPTQFQGEPNPTMMGYRSTEGAWYLQDEIKLKTNLTLRMGLRDEMTNGWNEATGRCGLYVFDANGVIKTDPIVGHSCLTDNKAKALWQPRVGLVWDPTGSGKWAVRAGFGTYYDLQDNLGVRLNANPPFNARLALTDPLLSIIPIPGGTQPPPNCNAQLIAAKQPCSTFQPSGVEPNLHTPAVQGWSLTVEREITNNFMLQLTYVGSHSYHLPLSLNYNALHSQVCADPQGCISGGIGKATARVPQGTTYVPPGTRPNPFLANSGQTWFFSNNSTYEGGSISLVKRANRGLTFKTNYTFAKTMDLLSAVGNALGSNEPSAIYNPYDLKLNKGVAAFSLRHQFNANFSYELPFGNGRRWGNGASGWVDRLISDWQWNGIITAQSGFPFTPQAGSNISGTGTTENPDVPNRNATFSGPVILNKVGQWFNPQAYVLPTVGTFGNVARGSLSGPGLTTLDTSLFKKVNINERWKLQIRAEAFNILNHPNFSSPNPVVFSGNGINPSAGVITGTATTARQIQFAMKLMF